MNAAATSGARVSIDTRTLQPGDVYYALKGERLDGHDFVEAALAAGASAAVIAKHQAARFPPSLAGRLRPVPDPLAALQELARLRRRDWGGPLVAITGSAGKTTTKEMIAAVLGTRLRVLKTDGNFNNHIGLPLTLLRLEPQHQVAVIEMGMNHAGEIARLAAIAEPTCAVFTNVGEAHLGNFSSIEGIAAAKRELAEAIPITGSLVLNADDARVARFGEGFAGRIVLYRARNFQGKLQYSGRHNRANAAAAVATGSLFEIEPAAAVAAIEGLVPPPGRGQILHRDGMVWIHDCYNANPEAMRQMLEVLADTPARRRIAVLGEMRELGAASETRHRQLGTRVASAKVDALFAVRGDARYIVEGARKGGFAGPAEFFPDPAAAAHALKPFLRAGDAVLFKASRAVHLEDAIAALESEEKPTGT